MLRRFLNLILCFTTFSFPEAGGKSPKRSNQPGFTGAEEKNSAENQAVTVLAPGSSFEGVLKSGGDVEIRGSFQGELSCDGHILLCTNFQGDLKCGSIVLLDSTVIGNIHTDTLITLDQGSTIVGNTKSNNLVCAGKIRGDLDIKESLTLTAQSDVEGDIAAGTITMSQGAVFKGNIKMDRH